MTNEKTLLTRAGLREADRIIAAAQPEPESLAETVETTRALCSTTVRTAMESP